MVGSSPWGGTNGHDYSSYHALTSGSPDTSELVRRAPASDYSSSHALTSGPPDSAETERHGPASSKMWLGFGTSCVAIAAFVGAVLAIALPASVAVPNVFAPGSLVRRPRLFPKLDAVTDEESHTRIEFFVSSIVLETCVTAALAILARVMCNDVNAARNTILNLETALLPWMIVHDFLECTIFIAAAVMGYTMQSFGLCWEVWGLYITWIMACNIAETLCVGPPTPAGVLCSASPFFSERFDIGKDKIFVCLCFICGGLPGILLGIIGLICIVFPRAFLLKIGYHSEFVSSYFSSASYIADGCTRDTKFLLAVFEDFPIALCGLCVLIWQGPSPFVLALVVMNAIKVSFISVAKYYHLQNTGKWDNAYRGEIRLFRVLGGAAGCFGLVRAKISCDNRVANWLFELAEFDDAATHSRTVWRAMSDEYGERDFRTLQALQLHAKSLRFVSMEHARRQEAADLELQCWEMMKAAIGESHPQTLRSMDNYASSLSKLGRAQEAADLKHRCLEMKTTEFGDAHPETLKSMNNYANALDKLGRTEEAAGMFLKCWNMRKIALGEVHVDTLGSLCNYAISLNKLGRFEESASLQQQCWNMKKMTLGPAHIETLRSMGSYANSLGRMDRMEEASDVHLQCWLLRRDALGESCPETLKSMTNYASSLEKLGRIEEAGELRTKVQEFQSLP